MTPNTSSDRSVGIATSGQRRRAGQRHRERRDGPPRQQQIRGPDQRRAGEHRQQSFVENRAP
jgi:hypothetical protein